jgi:PIN like domain
VIHTPAEVFGQARLKRGLDDADWLPIVGRSGWVVFGRDRHILDREYELQAYLAAQVHMILLPGQANRQQIVDLLAANLADICAVTAARSPSVYWATPHGLVGYERRAKDRQRRRR